MATELMFNVVAVDRSSPLSRQLLPCAFFTTQNHFGDIDQLRTGGLTFV